MKKTLGALATLAATGTALAQSSVTMFGVVDAGVSYYQTTSRFVGVRGAPALNFVGTGDLKQSQWALTSGNYNNSRLGFRGTEDLGGGLAVSFWLESPMTNDDGVVGASTFGRRSTVSLSGDLGELRLGRDYTPTFWNDGIFDPFGVNGVGTNLIATMSVGPRTVSAAGVDRGLFSNANYIRASNSVGYILPPNLGGFYGQVMYAFNEQVKYDPGLTTPATPLNKSRTGGYAGGRFGYANGGLDIAAAYGESVTGDNYFLGETTKVKTANIGASYDFGIVKLFGELSRVKNVFDYVNPPPIGTGDFKGDGALLGATIPVGPALIRLAWSHVKLNYTSAPTVAAALVPPNPKADKFALGGVYNLSRRTALYATAALIKNKNGANFNANSTFVTGTPGFTNTFLTTGQGYEAKDAMGYDFGIRHAF
ncbi:porin [Variovorax rhizosphaerae]|uniref:Porin n=1 Tax=Variovorax rhizosphaerae TaxID=1836200 RepID=A0ABU8WYN3_9BURK